MPLRFFGDIDVSTLGEFNNLLVNNKVSAKDVFANETHLNQVSAIFSGYNQQISYANIEENVVTLDLSSANSFVLFLTSSVNSFSLINVPPNNVNFSLMIYQDSNLARTVDWTFTDNLVKWPGASSVNVTQFAQAEDLFSFATYGGSGDTNRTWYSFVGGLNLTSLSSDPPVDPQWHENYVDVNNVRYYFDSPVNINDYIYSVQLGNTVAQVAITFIFGDYEIKTTPVGKIYSKTLITYPPPVSPPDSFVDINNNRYYFRTPVNVGDYIYTNQSGTNIATVGLEFTSQNYTITTSPGGQVISRVPIGAPLHDNYVDINNNRYYYNTDPKKGDYIYQSAYNNNVANVNIEFLTINSGTLFIAHTIAGRIQDDPTPWLPTIDNYTRINTLSGTSKFKNYHITRVRSEFPEQITYSTETGEASGFLNQISAGTEPNKIIFCNQFGILTFPVSSLPFSNNPLQKIYLVAEKTFGEPTWNLNVSGGLLPYANQTLSLEGGTITDTQNVLGYNHPTSYYIFYKWQTNSDGYISTLVSGVFARYTDSQWDEYKQWHLNEHSVLPPGPLTYELSF